MSEERTEWAVVWFPPDAPGQTRVYESEAKARDRFAVAKELGHLPILSRRRVVVEDFVIVENGAAS